jgi:hypothetical protein
MGDHSCCEISLSISKSSKRQSEDIERRCRVWPSNKSVRLGSHLRRKRVCPLYVDWWWIGECIMVIALDERGDAVSARCFDYPCWGIENALWSLLFDERSMLYYFVLGLAKALLPSP